jgi:hypothetical protein
MTLPYPPELELGKLHAPPGGPRTSMDVPALVDHLVESVAGGIAVVGRELALPADGGGDDVYETFRAAIAGRITERRPNLTLATVRHLERVLRAELTDHEVADAESLHVILETIDGL